MVQIREGQAARVSFAQMWDGPRGDVWQKDFAFNAESGLSFDQGAMPFHPMKSQESSSLNLSTGHMYARDQGSIFDKTILTVPLFL